MCMHAAAVSLILISMGDMPPFWAAPLRHPFFEVVS